MLVPAKLFSKIPDEHLFENQAPLSPGQAQLLGWTPHLHGMWTWGNINPVKK
jgi:hypothetical protein